MDMKIGARFSIVLVVILAIICANIDIGSAVVQNKLKSFSELLVAAKQLESAEMLLSSKSKNFNSKRNELLAMFVTEPKTPYCDRHYNQMIKVVADYKIKVYEYFKDGNNWITNLVRFGGPIASMRSLSKFDNNLNQLTQHYEALAKHGLVNNTNIDCDLAKFQIAIVDTILFVLKTDIKYLISADPQVINVHNLLNLSQNKYVSRINSYSSKLTPRQQLILLEYYSGRVDSNIMPIELALENFYNPGALVVGRLFDSCQGLLRYSQTWQELESMREEDCASGEQATQSDVFDSSYDAQKYEEVRTLCKNFLESDS